MRTITNGTLSVLAYDANVWKQERNVVKVTDTGATQVALCYPNISTIVASYTLDENHQVVIDMTDFIRVNGTQSGVYIRSNSGGLVLADIGYTIKGLINPESVIIPEHTPARFTIAPPRMIYKNNDYDPIAEVFVKSLIESETLKIGDDSVTPNSLCSVELVGDFSMTSQTGRFPAITLAKYKLREQLCGHRYAVVRWVSAFGTTKTFTWEVVEASSKTANDVDLISADGSYNRMKGRVDSFCIMLDNLNTYDLWYYADVCHSSKVEVSLDGGSTFVQVDVVTDGVTIPDGESGEFNKLKIELKYKNYDAASM